MLAQWRVAPGIGRPGFTRPVFGDSAPRSSGRSRQKPVSSREEDRWDQESTIGGEWACSSLGSGGRGVSLAEGERAALPVPPVAKLLAQLLSRAVEHDPEVAFGNAKLRADLTVGALLDFVELEYLRAARRQSAESHFQSGAEL